MVIVLGEVLVPWRVFAHVSDQGGHCLCSLCRHGLGMSRISGISQQERPTGLCAGSCQTEKIGEVPVNTCVRRGSQSSRVRSGTLLIRTLNKIRARDERNELGMRGTKPSGSKGPTYIVLTPKQVCIYIYVYMYICIGIQSAHTYKYIHIYLIINTHTRTYMHVYIYICIYILGGLGKREERTMGTEPKSAEDLSCRSLRLSLTGGWEQ